MTLIISAVLMVTVTLGFGLLGGPLIQRTAPLLMRTPRTAVVVLLTTLVMWLAAIMAIGPMLAWILSGPNQFMPGNSALVCQQCLQAASPFSVGPEIYTVLPVVVFLAAPLVLGAIMATAGTWFRYRRGATLKALSRSLPCNGQRTTIAGHRVLLMPSPSPVAFALPKRRCGIVISPALVELLTEDELRAVLAHEAAHLKQRHHLILALLHGLVRPLRWIPLVGAIEAAVPHYLEMAADHAARTQAGTPALARALLKLGEKPQLRHVLGDPAVALHAAGTDRIRHLVAPPTGVLGVGSATVMLAVVGFLTAASFAIHLPYLHAILTGCFVV